MNLDILMKIKLFTRRLNFQTILAIAVFLVLTGFDNLVLGQTTQTFTTDGSFTVPAGVTSIKVECWGAGGGGSTRTSSGRGGGGGGGAYASSIITVTPGNSYNILVGVGGAANTSGGNSTFNTNSVVAAGGRGGTSNSTAAGTGGSTANSTGTIEFAGGNGASGGSVYSGGGGGGAGSMGAGGDASGATAGTGTFSNGGDGGAGVSGNQNGLPGSNYGGGGSGAVRTSGTRTGGSGANGLVVVSWVSISGVSTETCVGGSTGTITASGNGGTLPYTYSLNGAAYQASGTFTGLAAAAYIVTIKDNSGLTTFTTVTVNEPATSADDQNAAGSDSWIGHVYDGSNFSNYIGYYNEAETFNESFGGNTNCFNVTSNSLTRSIYTETFSVRYRMNSTKKGLYIADLGSDDGSRLTVDGTLLYNNWNDQGFSTRARVLMSLNGASSLVYDFYENGGGNQVVFQNFTNVLSNTLATNVSQTICQGSTGSPISGDTYGSLPSGISLSGTGYQWSYSLTPSGARSDISGATSASFTPDASVAPFNTAGTYYIFRNAILRSSNNVSPNPYIATNESNAATVTVNPLQVATFSYTGNPYCQGAANPLPSYSGGGVAGTFSSTAGLIFVNTSTGQINLSASMAGTYTVTNTISAAGGCSQVIASSNVTITPSVATPVFALGTSSSRAQGAGTTAYTATAANNTGITYSIDAASLAAGITISSTTGSVTYTPSWSGASIITATASGCDGPTTANHIATTSGAAIYYSYQTGNWNQPSTWTFDPGGSTGPVSTIPGNSDEVVILSGRTVTLNADVATTNQDITIQTGGFLNQSTFRFTTTLSALRGGGTLQLSSANFPSVTNNTFVTTDGGTTEYTTTGAFDLPAAQTIYYHLSINNTGETARQINNLVINGNLNVKNGTFQINNATATRRQLTIKGNVAVDYGASITVGTGNTVNGTDTPLTVSNGGTSPFINYYNSETHRVIIQGDFINNGTVKFTNQTAPKYDAFTNTGAATVYFQGSSNNLLTCNGTTDFYNLIVDKGTDQTFNLTIYSNAYQNFRLFGANTAPSANSTVANPDLKKALWVRNGTLILQGLTVIPSLSEGVSAGPPATHYYIPANGAIVLDGPGVIVLTTADDFTEVQAAYNLTGGSNVLYGINNGNGSVSGLSILGKLQINNGYLSTRESAGILYWSYSSGRLTQNGGILDTKQITDGSGSNTGLFTYRQSGGKIILRGRFQNAINYSVPDDLSNATINTTRSANGIDGTAGVGTFHINTNLANGFIMSGGNITIYDVTGTTSTSYAAFIGCPASNINVTGGTVSIIPTTGSGTDIDYLINTKAPFGNFIVNRASGATKVILNSNSLLVLQNLDLTSGVLDANLQDISIGGNFTISTGTTYTCTGTSANRTIFNGSSAQNFTVNLTSSLNLNKLTIDKPEGTNLVLSGSQSSLYVTDSLILLNGGLNDNGKTVNSTGNIYNSGVHSGTGKIVMNNDATQSIGGDGTGEFANLELNKPTNGSISVILYANTFINGTLTFSGTATGYKLFNIQGNNLSFSASASISGADANRYIQTNGLLGDGGVTKTYSASATSFTFQVGAPSVKHTGVPNYTPATISVSGTPTTYGKINIVPVGAEHPNTTTKNRSLFYYWKVSSVGFVLGSATISQGYIYSQNDVPPATGDISESGFVAARYLKSTYTWTRGTNSDIDVTNNIVGQPGFGSFLKNVNFIDGDYTAGDDNATNPFGTPIVYYSRQSGLWGNLATWSLTSHTVTNTPSAAPGISDIVVIGGQDSVYLATNNTTPNTDVRSCASLQIEVGSALDIGYNPNCSFGVVRNHINGNGNFRLTTSYADQSTFTFPSGDFSDFNINLGTTELYSTNSIAGTTYWLPNGITSYGNLILSPLGGSNIIFPNNDLTIYGNLITRGQNADSWFCPAWESNYPTAPSARIAKTITINGNLDIQGGALIFYGYGAITQNFVIFGDVKVAPNAALYVYSGATSQNMSIGGSLVNNTVGTTAGGTTTVRKCDFTSLPLTFFGSNSSSVTNTLNNPLTIFSTVTVNKGTSQATTLTLDIGGTLTTPTNNWLTLQNGTLKYMRTNPNSDFTISAATAFTIPATAGLYIDYANSGNKNVLIANSASNTNDLYLFGKLTLLNGNVYIGPTNGTTVNNNDIEYSSGGLSSIDVQGGNLIVNGQIRRNPLNSGGILTYNQSGGSVKINGQAALAANAKLEVLNNGSSFNMSNGTLTIVKGGGTTFGDLYLRPQAGSVTGGTIIFSPATNGAQTYQLDANISLNHLTLSGTAGNVATAKLMVSPLILNGDLTITTNSVFNANNINCTFNGNFINNVGTAGYLAGKNLTTFSASNSSSYLGAQSITGTTNFYNLLISPGASLTIGNSCNVQNDLTLSSGNLIIGSNLILVSGNLVNNGRYTDSNLANTGISLMGSVKQYLSGNGSFGRLEINNGFGVQTLNDITLEENLALTLGIFDINKYLLSLGLQSNILGAPYSSSKMIRTDGVFSDQGVRKLFPAGPNATFVYPIGCLDKYTPSTLNITAGNTVGYIQVSNVNQQHPAVIDPANALNYYWEVTSSGITGLSGTLLFNYLQSDVKGTQESNYFASRLIVPGTSWSLTNTLDVANNIITFNHTGSNNLGGEYTAGISSAFPPDIPIYTSNKNGNWTDKTIWTQTGGTTYPCPDGGPNGFIVIIDHEVTANSNYCLAYRTTINNKLKIVSPYFGHNLGTVDGNGTLYLESGSFPAGVYTSFLDCSNNGTVEYSGSGTYSIIADLFTNIPNLLVTGNGTRVLPAKDLTICKSLKINGPTLDNSINNQKLTILGTMEIAAGSFASGTGSNATVSFAGTATQTIGGLLGNFTGSNAFNNFEINNISGVSVNTGGDIEVKGELRLTNGLINTNPLAPWNCGTLKVTNTSINCIVPSGGSSASFVNGPLSKSINQGDEFLFPVGLYKSGVGNIAGNKLKLSSSKSGTILWTAEYKNPNPTFASFAAPLQGVSSKEFWTLKALSGSKSIINITWNPESDVTPLVTQNGLSDMSIGIYNTGTSSWNQVISSALGDDYNGTASTSGFTTSTGSNDYTLASLTILRPKAKLDPLGPICGNSGIPVSFVSQFAISLNYTLSYTVNGIAQTPVVVSSLPYILPTPVPGNYKLTGFTYNNGSGTGVVDATTITVNDIPTTADAGPDQSLCGITSANMNANPGGVSVGTGVWSIISGIGGTIITPTSRTSQFIGLNGKSYKLRWTISNGTCISTDDVIVNFNLTPLAPAAASTQTLCTGMVITDIQVTPPSGSTVSWFSAASGGSPLPGTQLLVSGDYYAESNAGTGCTSPTRTKVTVTIIQQVWTGNVSTSWNVAGNWSCGTVPNLTSNIQIPNVVNKPILSGGAIGTVNNIVIDNSSSLTVTGNTLQIAGTITNNGTFTATAGTIEMKGTSAQTLGSGVFASNTILGFTVNNPAGVTLSGPLNVTGVVNALSGNLSSGGNLTLISTATQTALIDGTGSGTITGNVTMQRYLPSGYGYKYVSSPFQAATVNELADDIDLAASFPTLYKYDEDNHRDSSGVSIYTTGWSKYLATTNPLIPMQGYAANFGNSAAAKTFNITGIVNNNIVTTQTLYNHNRTFTKGFNLAGNPYPSPINWNAATGWTKTNIDNALYFFDNGTTDQYTGLYSSYVNGVSSNGIAGNIISSMQGFFIHVSDGSFPVTAALGMDNRVRVNNLTPAYHKSAYVDQQPIVRITAAYENSKTADPAVVYFDDQASVSFDQQLDALKLLNTDISVPNLYSVTPDIDKLSINAIPFPIENTTKNQLGIKTEKSDWVLISASLIEYLPSGLRVYLSDEATGMVQDLQMNPQYRVHLNSGAVDNRFALLFSEQDLVKSVQDEDTFYANIVNGKLTVFVKLASGSDARLVISNMLGQVMLRDDKFEDGSHEFDRFLPTGMYVITLYSQKGMTSKKIYIPK